MLKLHIKKLCYVIYFSHIKPDIGYFNNKMQLLNILIKAIIVF